MDGKWEDAMQREGHDDEDSSVVAVGKINFKGLLSTGSPRVLCSRRDIAATTRIQLGVPHYRKYALGKKNHSTSREKLGDDSSTLSIF